jgi:3-keto-disaccharide hydrolase
MKITATAICATILLAACAWTAAAQTAPVPGKDGWISMFDGKTLTGWKANENPESWKAVDGAIVGDGERSHLFWMERECENCEFRAEVKLNHSGNSGMYVRAAFGPGFPKGYETQVENTSPDPQKTGSLYGICKVTEQLVQDDTWWTQDVTIKGNHVTVKINGKTVTDCDDPQARYTKGYLVLQQHNKGSVVMYRNLMMRPLP